MTARLREAALWMGAALGLLSVVAGTAVMFFGYSFLIFRSGSMGPEIPTGSLALATTVPAAELEPGDVVSVVSVTGARITHRLVSSTVRGDVASLILQGDTNATPDDEIYQVTEAEREIASVPYLGYVVTVLLSPAGLIGVGCISGMMLLLSFGSQPGQPHATSRGGRHRKVAMRRLALRRTTTLGVAFVAVVAGVSVNGTSAFFTDVARVSSGSHSSTGIGAPTNVRCVSDGSNSYINWNRGSGPMPSSYRVFYNTTALLVPSGSQVVNAPTNYQPPGNVANADYTITVVATFNNWTSPVSNSATIRMDRAGARYRC